MNTANLQLQGLCMAIASINNALVEKALLTRAEVAVALEQSEERALAGEAAEGRSAAARDAIAFPSRILALANSSPEHGPLPPFGDLARIVGETKDLPHL